ncbi:MAG: HDOD domain-containing protein [Gammaproteobacteria bacterium]|nr:HDOD domain-containing protein [Gammaproteobacteria bacterium]
MATVNPFDVTLAHGLRGLDMLVAEVDKLVSLPDIYYRLEEAIVDPGSTIDSIAELLRRDPDLCARMLRMANSAFYSFPTKIETIERAVSTIGLRQIRELVLVTSVIKAFEGIPSSVVNMTTFWEHSVAVGIMARELGEHSRLANADSFYIPGLLHDIGRLVMFLKLPGLMHDILKQRKVSGEPMYLLERRRLDYSHAEIGGRLLEFWKLPQSIWEPVVTHHDPRKAGQYALAGCAVHIADAWVNSNRIGSSGQGFELEIEPEALERFGIAADDVDEIGAHAAAQTQAVVRQFMGH